MTSLLAAWARSRMESCKVCKRNEEIFHPLFMCAWGYTYLYDPREESFYPYEKFLPTIVAKLKLLSLRKDKDTNAQELHVYTGLFDTDEDYLKCENLQSVFMWKKDGDDNVLFNYSVHPDIKITVIQHHEKYVKDVVSTFHAVRAQAIEIENQLLSLEEIQCNDKKVSEEVKKAVAALKEFRQKQTPKLRTSALGLFVRASTHESIKVKAKVLTLDKALVYQKIKETLKL